MSTLSVNFIDTYFTDVLSSAAGLLTPVALVPSGEGDSTRLASSLQALKLDCNVVYDVPDQVTSSPAGDCFRMMVVYDHQPNAGTPSIADTIVQTYTGAIPAFMAHPNFDNDNRFDILHDSVESVNPMGLVASHNIQTVVARKYSIDLSSVGRTVFQAGTTNIQSGALYIIFIPFYALAGSHPANIFCNSRLWYKFL